MARYSQVAASVRRSKERSPENYCWHPRCLWNVVTKPCPKHGPKREVR